MTATRLVLVCCLASPSTQAFSPQISRRGLTIHSSRSRFAARLNSGVSLHMKHLAVLTSVALLSGCATCAGGSSGIEQRNKHAGGFCEATRQVSGDFGFEGIGHFNHCFYRSRDFGQCSSMSVSPSASIALWQDSATGAIVAFRPSWPAPRTLLPKFPVPSSLESTSWDESAGFATVKAWNHPETFQLAIPGGG